MFSLDFKREFRRCCCCLKAKARQEEVASRLFQTSSVGTATTPPRAVSNANITQGGHGGAGGHGGHYRMNHHYIPCRRVPAAIDGYRTSNMEMKDSIFVPSPTSPSHCHLASDGYNTEDAL